MSLITRTGIGYDVHQLVEGRPLILGGVEIPHSLGLLGHSDADVLSHAIADAILGALGKPDIGYYFPPTDPTIEGISSLEILKKCADVVAESEGTLWNVDATLVAERPKIRPHVDDMRENISSALGLHPSQVGIKATTNETMGFPGREEGMAAMAVATVQAPL
ncbi:MAG: 2-C-methyl-D-erythritol 2,4-cyclodiphosphate synthase, partial [Verrucomicrobiota bacterium]